MDLLPRKRVNAIASSSAKAAAKANSSDGMGRGMEFAILVLMFLGVGYALDRWFGTKPVFMIILVTLALIGQFASMWYGYEARMKQLETERRETTRQGKAAVR